MKAMSAKKQSLPLSFKPLLWDLKWTALNVIRDREDIILATINEGTLAQWKWITDVYGKKTVRAILEHRLATEFHPESRNLARVIFGVKQFRNARKHTHAFSKKNISSSR